MNYEEIKDALEEGLNPVLFDVLAIDWVHGYIVMTYRDFSLEITKNEATLSFFMDYREFVEVADVPVGEKLSDDALAIALDELSKIGLEYLEENRDCFG